MKKLKEIILNGNDLTLDDMVAVARDGVKVRLSEEAVKNVLDSRKIIDHIVENEKTVYGVTTGFGEFCNVTISKEDCKSLQENLIRSHACGYGPKFPSDTVRAIMVARANALSKGYSGIRLETLNTLIDMINKGVHPSIPEKGSLGASGDLAPLAHMVLPMLGLGEAEYKGEILQGKEAMDRAGIPIIQLDAKEGLALINGTQVLTATGALATYDAINLLKISDIAAALTMEALRGITDAFDERIHIIRPHKGQLATARNILRLVDESTYVTRQGQLRVQDAYSIRCVPQIHGASKDTVNYVKDKVEIEINSVTDNPIITREGDVISGGNFHGEPMALSFDFLGIGAAEIADVSERRLERLINHQLNDLPAFLAKHGGLNSGFMITQYAAAALVSENKILAHPASVDSIPSSANQEDLVSMGTIAARTARDIIKNATRVVATEIMAACQAIDFRKEDKMNLGKGTSEAYRVVRSAVDFIENDKDIEMYKYLDKATELIENGTLLEAVEEKVALEY
ncbi:MAG: histidine ammonia-lyase [Clostridium sp.]|uniref:histidine ammonia-lyase n=1 Tax=Clostridium sp. TaxID=1506 RepID=UPI002A89E2CE|nr:histidine ammonia-lyase [Clostridium sp.]MDY5097311.1 histidine ammonia-lyase [Clostridium sp.]